MKRSIAVSVVVLLSACASTKTAPDQPAPENLHGTASWYGQEFAGRATANGEIFDPMQFTAAHRTLPFGTIVEVKNPKTGETVRVRVNDRGPYIYDRLIDLSYAAARQIGLIEPGTGEVQLTVVKWGKGDREPPAPYVVSVPEVKPLPDGAPAAVMPAATIDQVPVVVDKVQVVEEHGGLETRRQVSNDGRRIETVPMASATQKASASPKPSTFKAAENRHYVVQVGAFAQENNAKMLQDQLSELGEKAFIEHGQLSYVRLGPFSTRDEAVRMRTRLETAGLSAIVVKQ